MRFLSKTIDEVTNTCFRAIVSLGFSAFDSKLIVRNIIEAELADKKSHGIIRVLRIMKDLNLGKLKTDPTHTPFVESSTNTTLYIDGVNKPGVIAIYKALDFALTKLEKTDVLAVGVRNIGCCSGYIGDYARIIAESGYIFISFNSSPAWLVPYGASQRLWGTNPITVGFPSKTGSVIFDAASSIITKGELDMAHETGTKLPKGVAMDKFGRITTDPGKVLSGGGLLPSGLHKGSGLAFVVELLARVLVNNDLESAWGGSFFILINPCAFQRKVTIEDNLKNMIKNLGNVSRQKGFEKIYFPGEKSDMLRAERIKRGVIKVEKNIWGKVNKLIKN